MCVCAHTHTQTRACKGGDNLKEIVFVCVYVCVTPFRLVLSERPFKDSEQQKDKSIGDLVIECMIE